VEPRDLAGNIVEAPGDVSVALLDPAQSGEQARLARWDFTAAETEQMIHSGAQPGIHLRLPLTAGPSHDRLKLYVRYTTRDGLKFQAEQAIVLALNSRRPSGEAPSSAAERPAQQMAERPARPQWSPMR
jgi:hypothetical protein